tara:strand:+ start:775 stop:3489 length:2715 start_codon:yes stop_codon:yes gene_type:complete
MPKQTLKIEGFHGGLNTNADPRDIQDNQSPDSLDVSIDSLGRIKTLGSTSQDDSTSNDLKIVPNRGLFTMSSDKQLDGGTANETFIIAFDDTDNAIDIKDSEGWDNNVITNFDTDHPVFYVGDGNLRAGDGEFDNGVSNKWFGYIEDERFDSLLADSGAIGWTQANQAIEKPTLGKCLISTPFSGSDTNGVNSSSSEYIGSVIDLSSDDVADLFSVNLRVGLQYNSFRGGNAASYNSVTNATKSDSLPVAIHPLFSDNIYVEGTSGTASILLNDTMSVTLNEEKNIIFGIWIPNAKYTNFSLLKFTVNETGVSPNTSLTWEFPKEDFKVDCWNIVSLNMTNITEGDASGVGLDNWQLQVDRSATDCDFYFSGPIIADNPSLEGFQSGLYTFNYSFLYDDEKQESLPFLFRNALDDVNVNKLNVIGSPVLFNFDFYINPFDSAAIPVYSISKRITGSRVYYKLEDNDNFFLIGELDFVNKGFKFLPEEGEMSYSMADVTGDGSPTGENWYKTSVIVKGISPSSSNMIDSYRSINGYAANTQFIDAKFKTAVVHGRRVYIGNIRQPSGTDGKNHPDRMLKSAVNKFDIFPNRTGSIDVAINDGESIVKLEAFADRILQFKEKTMYVINVSENVDFLEDRYENKGCSFDYHTTKTDYGIAWFNAFGVYFYDGKQVLNLLEKDGMRLISESDWETFITDNDSDMSEAHIAYVPKKRQLLIKNRSKNIFIYDFVLRAWMKGSGQIRIFHSSNNDTFTNMTNFALNGNQDLIYLTNDDCDVMTWNPSPAASASFLYTTKDIDFGQPSVRKKIYKVYVTYKSGNATTNVIVDYDINGGTTFPYDFENGTNFSSNMLAAADGWQQATLKPDNSSEANNVFSFRLRFQIDSSQVPAGFEINDITIVYRLKNVR